MRKRLKRVLKQLSQLNKILLKLLFNPSGYGRLSYQWMLTVMPSSFSGTKFLTMEAVARELITPFWRLDGVLVLAGLV
jgi:hypothetical protein